MAERNVLVECQDEFKNEVFYQGYKSPKAALGRFILEQARQGNTVRLTWDTVLSLFFASFEGETYLVVKEGGFNPEHHIRLEDLESWEGVLDPGLESRTFDECLYTGFNFL